MVYDVILAAAEASSMRIVDFICFATPKGETDSREVGNRVELKTLKPDSVIAVVKEMGKQNPNPNKSPLGGSAAGFKLPQHDVQAIIAAGQAAKLETQIRLEDDGKDDPIHDISTKGGVKGYNEYRLKYNEQFPEQFFYAESPEVAKALRIAKRKSKSHSLDVDLLWGKMDLLDIHQSITNIQSCNFFTNIC